MTVASKTLDSMWCVYFKSFPNFVQVVPHGLALLVQVPGGGAQGLVAAGHRLVPGGLLLQLRLNRTSTSNPFLCAADFSLRHKSC